MRGGPREKKWFDLPKDTILYILTTINSARSNPVFCDMQDFGYYHPQNIFHVN